MEHKNNKSATKFPDLEVIKNGMVSFEAYKQEHDKHFSATCSIRKAKRTPWHSHCESIDTSNKASYMLRMILVKESTLEKGDGAWSRYKEDIVNALMDVPFAVEERLVTSPRNCGRRSYQ